MSQLLETFVRFSSSQPKQTFCFCSGLRLSWKRLMSASGFSTRQVDAHTGAFAATAAAAATPADFMKLRRDTPSPQSGQLFFGSTIGLSPLSFLMYCNTLPVKGNVRGKMLYPLLALL